MNQFNILARLVAITLLVPIHLVAQAQGDESQWPTRPIRLIVGYPPGGGADAVARVYGNKLSELLKQPVVIDNKPGAGTTIAAEQAASAPPDGYTLYMGGPSMFGVDKVLYPQIRYDATSFTPISRMTSSPLLLVSRIDAPYKNVNELIEYARKNPEKVFFTSSGNGGSPHMAGALFMERFDIKMTHVPYKGGAQSVQAVVATDADITFATPPSVLPLVKAGRLNAIAITANKKSRELSEFPTIAAQTSADYDVSFWFGLFAPKGTPTPVVMKLFEATQSALKAAPVAQQLALQGNEVALSESPQEFSRWVVEQGKSHAKVARATGVKVD